MNLVNLFDLAARPERDACARAETRRGRHEVHEVHQAPQELELQGLMSMNLATAEVHPRRPQAPTGPTDISRRFASGGLEEANRTSPSASPSINSQGCRSPPQ